MGKIMCAKFYKFHPIAFVILLASSGLSWADKDKFVQDRFAIGLWSPPATSVDLAERYKEIAEADFNLVIRRSAG